MPTIDELLASQPAPRPPPADKLPILDVALHLAQSLPPGSVTQQLVLARRQQGVDRYGLPLCTHNGRDARADAAQEALDLAVYLHQLSYELQGKCSKEQSEGLTLVGLGMLDLAVGLMGLPKP
jgi:hypothetical protein